MKKIVYLLLLSVAVIACQQSNNKVTFSSVKYEKEVNLGNDLEAEITAVIPHAEGDSKTAKNINDKVFATVKSIVGQENDASTNYDELLNGFIKNYQTFLTEIPDYRIGWEADVKGIVEYETADIINIKLDSYTMTGGAHGNPYTTSLLFDAKNGNEISVSDLIADKDDVTRMAEKKFREKYNIPADGSLNDAGYMFDNDTFVLPQNIFVTKDGLLLFYNVYESAAYVEGTKEVLLPYDEVKDYLRIKIR